MRQFELFYESPSALGSDPNTVGFRQETIEFSAEDQEAAMKWVDEFVCIGTMTVLDPKSAFTRRPGQTVKRIEVPKRRPLLLVEIVKKY